MSTDLVYSGALKIAQIKRRYDVKEVSFYEHSIISGTDVD